MKRISALALTALLLATAPAYADVAVQNAKSFETAAGMKTGAALMELNSDIDDKLIGASSPVAERVEIHTMADDNGIMKMRKVDGIDLAANKPVILDAAGYHLMLINLTAPLKAESEFEVTLTFEKSEPKTVTVPVLSRAQMNRTLNAPANTSPAEAPAADHGGEHHH